MEYGTDQETVLSQPYQTILTIEPGKRGGRPCIRGMRISVYDVLSYLAAGMTHEEILADLPYLTEDDIRACLSYAADGERQLWLWWIETRGRSETLATHDAHSVSLLVGLQLLGAVVILASSAYVFVKADSGANPRATRIRARNLMVLAVALLINSAANLVPLSNTGRVIVGVVTMALAVIGLALIVRYIRRYGASWRGPARPWTWLHQ
jgi:uncharacterized protein (DUF433 family)